MLHDNALYKFNIDIDIDIDQGRSIRGAPQAQRTAVAAAGCLQTGCPSYHPTNSAKALQEY